MTYILLTKDGLEIMRGGEKKKSMIYSIAKRFTNKGYKVIVKR